MKFSFRAIRLVASSLAVVYLLGACGGADQALVDSTSVGAMTSPQESIAARKQGWADWKWYGTGRGPAEATATTELMASPSTTSQDGATPAAPTSDTTTMTSLDSATTTAPSTDSTTLTSLDSATTTTPTTNSTTTTSQDSATTTAPTTNSTTTSDPAVSGWPRQIDINASRTFAVNGNSPYTDSTAFIHALGGWPTIKDIPETGLLGAFPWSSDGSYARLKRIQDPNPPGGVPRTVFDLRIHRNDPDQAGPGLKRVEFAGGHAGIDVTYDGTTYWYAVQYMFPEAATLQATDPVCIAGLHAPSGAIGGPFGIYLLPNGVYQAKTDSSLDPAQPASWANTTYTYHNLGSATINVWDTFVVKFRTGANGILQVWRNGTLLVNYSGRLGYADWSTNYIQPIKLYNWAWGQGWGDYSRPERRILARGAVFGVDQPGLTEASVRAALQ